MSESFTYTYSAAKQAEIDQIRQKYVPPEEQDERLEALRKLDAAAGRPGMIAAIAVGLTGVLIFGLGMSCVMAWNLMIPGVLLGLLGFAGVALALPLYNRITEKRRAQLAPEILHLTEELQQTQKQ